MRIAMTEKKVETLANHIECLGHGVLAQQLRRMPKRMGGGYILTDMMYKLYRIRATLKRGPGVGTKWTEELLDEFLLWVEHGFMNSEDMILEARNAYEVMPLAWDRGQALLNIIDRELGSKAAK